MAKPALGRYLTLCGLIALLWSMMLDHPIAQDGGWLALAVLLFFALSCLPLFINWWLKRRNRSANWLYGATLLLFGIPLFYLYLINPFYERWQYTTGLKAISISQPEEQVVRTPDGQVVGLKLTYQMHVPRALFTTSKYSVPYPEPSLTRDDNSYYPLLWLAATTITLNDKSLPGGLITPPMAVGTYTVEAVFLPPYALWQQSNPCERDDPLPGVVAIVEAELVKVPAQVLRAHFITRFGLSNRMGIFNFESTSLPLQWQFPGVDIVKAIRSLPVCKRWNQ